MPKAIIELDVGLIKKYEKEKSPYYTTYPTGGEWGNDFSSEDYLKALEQTLPKNREVPMALYIHIPFCKRLCYFCFCITYITGNREQINKFTKYIFREIEMLNEFFKKNSIIPEVKEIHLGGGTPTYLTKDEFDQLIEKLQLLADVNNLDEFALEIDPRTVTKDDMGYYFSKGINRISFGIQDFDPHVQKAVNRVHSPELISELIPQEVRKFSVNFDLIYGLPFQTRKTFRNTIEEVKKLSPDRISLYNYDHTPNIHGHQKLLNPADMPDIDQKTIMYIESVRNLLDNGYEWVGIDHFAKPNDKLAKAARNGTLGRNLNGYTTGRAYDIELGLGPSSIGSFGRCYVQSIKSLPEYYKSINEGKFPILRGSKLNDDDILRREVIINIICNGFVSFNSIEKKYNIKFQDYFKNELGSLHNFEEDGLLKLFNDKIVVQPVGRVFVQHIAKTFDKYLQEANKRYIRTHEAIKLDALKVG